MVYLIRQRENRISFKVNTQGVAGLFTVIGSVDGNGVGSSGRLRQSDGEMAADEWNEEQAVGTVEGIHEIEQEINGSARCAEIR